MKFCTKKLPTLNDLEAQSGGTRAWMNEFNWLMVTFVAVFTLSKSASVQFILNLDRIHL